MKDKLNGIWGSGRRRVIAALTASAALVMVSVPATGAETELDPQFGENGVATIANADRHESQGAPLVGANGRIVVGGLVRNASDRIFLGGLTGAGQLDSSFGEAGEVQTNTKATWRRAATAQQPDGRLVVAGRADNGRLQLERFNADGGRDITFGTSGNGRLTVEIPGGHTMPTGLAVTNDAAYVSLTNPEPRDGHGFTVAKLNSTGLAAGFGQNGVTTVSFGSEYGYAFDLALAEGSILVTGAIGGPVTPGGAPGNARVDTRVARLGPNGALDQSFGANGIREIDAAGSSRWDFGVSVLPTAAGGAHVVSAADGKAAIVALDPGGNLDSGFGSGGVAAGLAPAGTGLFPVDADRDSRGKIAVAGWSRTSGVTRWVAMRSRTAGADPLDPDFGNNGFVVLDRCSNSDLHGPSGITALNGFSVLIAGDCGENGRVAVAKLTAATDTKPGAVSFEINPGSAAAGHEQIPIGDLDPSAVAGGGEALQAAGLRRTGLRRTGLRRTGLRRTGLASTGLRRTALGGTLLSELPLVGTTWQEVLGVDVPIQTLTLEDAFNINPDAVGALTLEDIDPDATGLRRTSLAAFALGVRPLSALPAPGGGWCDFLAGQPYNCGNGVDPSQTTLFDLEIGGDDLSAYYEEPISLLATNLGTGDDAAPLAGVLLAEMNLDVAPFRDTKASEVSSILACSATCQGTLADQSEADLGDATLGELVGVLPVPSLQDLSVGQSLVAIVPPSEIPYELMGLQRLLDQASFRSEDLLSARVPFDVECGNRGGLRAVLELAGDARPVPGSATVAVGGGQPKPLDDPAGSAYDLQTVCENREGEVGGVLRFDIEPGSVLGLDLASKIRIESGSNASGAGAENSVDDSRDPGDEAEQTLKLSDDAIRTGHIVSDSDIDSFEFKGVPGETTISLSHLPADYDLVILGPELGPESTGLRRTGLRRTDLSATSVPDSSEEPTDPSVLPPDTVEDLGLRRTGLRRTGLRRTSINRGTSDEAATIEIRPEEAGETFYAQVIGFNGAESPKPYVIRRVDRPTEAAPECPARPLGGSGISLPFPGAGELGTATEALFLVNPGRMAARDGVTPTQEMLDELETLAAQTDGVIVPVDADPTIDTGAAYSAWDQDPCSAQAANEVVTEINRVVDHVREMGEGLPELRSIVLVGPDDVLPQGRIPDHTALANEGEYADDATVNLDEDPELEDNSVSGSIRERYLLSDDPYGDFDPGERLWVPDVALGRLIETPAQIKQQILDFSGNAGVVDPQRAFVTGYDFISDGAADKRDALAGRVGEGATTSLINETWTAVDARDGINAPGAGFLTVNAHYDHYRMLPAAAFNNYDPNLLEASETSAAPGSVAFTVGCHAGLNLAIAAPGGEAGGAATAAAEPRLGDWAERMSAQRGALYAANTGYGYGDSEVVAYSERLMADYAVNLASGDVTTGQALMFAKQTSAATIGVSDDYWNKAMMEATFYGLPMYRVGADGGVGEPAVPPVADPGAGTASTGGPQATGGIGSRSSSPLTLDLADDLHEVETERGSHWQVGGEEPLVVQHRPIEPKVTRDVTDEDDPEARARAFLIEGMTTEDRSGVNPVIARPTIDLSANEPEPEASSPFFPARPATVAPQATPDGHVDRLTFIAGSTRGDTQRLIKRASGRILRSTGEDYTAPTIRRVDGNVVNGRFSIRVEVDGSDALGGNVLYLTNEDGGGDVSWHRADLSVVGDGVLATGGELPSGSEISESVVQVFDTSHNLATSSNKVVGHSFSPPPEGDPGDPRVVLTPEPPASGYYDSGSPEISLDPGEHGDAAFEYSVDGDAYRRYNGPFTVSGPAEGEHSVVFRGNDGSTAIERFAIDTKPPTIVADVDRTAGENGWYDGPVTVSFRCADAVSGVRSCPDPVTLSDDGRNQSVEGTATDHAGHSASTRVDGINIDSTDPEISGEAQRAPNADGWYNAPVDLTYRCSDGLSGLASCAGRDLDGGPEQATTELTLAGEGADQQATESAFDRAGNRGEGGVTPPISIDMTKPSVAITTPSGTILAGSSMLQGTATDALSRVKSVVVTYTSLTGQRVVRTAELYECGSNGACKWRAEPPGTGAWRAFAVATDHAANSASTPETGYSIVVR